MPILNSIFKRTGIENADIEFDLSSVIKRLPMNAKFAAQIEYLQIIRFTSSLKFRMHE